MGTQDSNFNLRLAGDLRDALERIAVEKERSIAWVVRDAITRYAAQEDPENRR